MGGAGCRQPLRDSHSTTALAPLQGCPPNPSPLPVCPSLPPPPTSQPPPYTHTHKKTRASSAVTAETAAPRWAQLSNRSSPSLLSLCFQLCLLPPPPTHGVELSGVDRNDRGHERGQHRRPAPGGGPHVDRYAARGGLEPRRDQRLGQLACAECPWGGGAGGRQGPGSYWVMHTRSMGGVGGWWVGGCGAGVPQAHAASPVALRGTQRWPAAARPHRPAAPSLHLVCTPPGGHHPRSLPLPCLLHPTPTGCHCTVLHPPTHPQPCRAGRGRGRGAWGCTGTAAGQGGCSAASGPLPPAPPAGRRGRPSPVPGSPGAGGPAAARVGRTFFSCFS